MIRSGYRPEFEAALRLLARVSKAMDEAGYRPPVLVGGAAVEMYTRGAVTTGDFDISCSRQDILEAEMQREGFVRPSGPGVATRGWIHPELKLGFECVSDGLLNGLADREMVQIVNLAPDGDIAVIAPEDIIADRMGQYASGSASDMLGQARALFAICEGLDLRYMAKRISEERAANMAFKTFKTKREAVTLQALARRIAARKTAIGAIMVPRNAGKRRTSSKRALLKAIEDAGGDW